MQWLDHSFVAKLLLHKVQHAHRRGNKKALTLLAFRIYAQNKLLGAMHQSNVEESEISVALGLKVFIWHYFHSTCSHLLIVYMMQVWCIRKMDMKNILSELQTNKEYCNTLQHKTHLNDKIYILEKNEYHGQHELSIEFKHLLIRLLHDNSGYLTHNKNDCVKICSRHQKRNYQTLNREIKAKRAKHQHPTK